MSDITSPEQLIDTLLDTIIENEANQISLEDNYSAIKKLLMDYHPKKEKPYQIQTKVLTGETAGELQRILNHYLDALSLGKRRSVIDIKYSTMEKGASGLFGGFFGNLTEKEYSAAIIYREEVKEEYE